MNITKAQLKAQCKSLPLSHRLIIRAAVARAPHVDYALIRAVVSRETNMRNIVGDGGHGRGYFQIDDRSHATFLRKVGAGRGTPPVGKAARYAVALLEANVTMAINAGVPVGHRLRVAIAGYNCGMGNALIAWNNNRNPDARTAGGDYSADVIARAAAIRAGHY